jgi:hypothetical protein
MSTPLVRLLFIVILLAAAVVAPGIAQGAPAAQAPAFTLELFSGASLKLADLKGKAVVLFFWAEW